MKHSLIFKCAKKIENSAVSYVIFRWNKLKNVLVEFQTVLVEFQIVLVEIPILNNILSLNGDFNLS